MGIYGTLLSKKEGEKLENKVLRFVRDAVGDGLLFFPKWPVIGSAGALKTDITVSGPGDFDTNTKTGTLGPLKTVVECKFSKLGTAGVPAPTAWREPTRYSTMSNGERTKLFLVMKRLPESGETPRELKVLLDKMGASFINFGRETDRELLHREIVRLQRE